MSWWQRLFSGYREAEKDQAVPKDWQPYKSSFYGFELCFPRSWRVADENKPSGESTPWIVALGVVGPQYDEGCAAFMVNVHGKGAFGEKWNLQGRDVIPHSAKDFIPIARVQTTTGFDDVRNESAEVVTIAESEAARLLYSYVGGADRIREMSVFVFRSDSTYQLTFECPTAHFKKNQAVFDRIAASFRPPSSETETEDAELAKLRDMLGPGANLVSAAEIAQTDQALGELHFDCPKCNHRERVNDMGKTLLAKGDRSLFQRYTCTGCGHVFDASVRVRSADGTAFTYRNQ